MAVAALGLPLDGISTRGEARERSKDLGRVARVLLRHNAGDRREAVLKKEADGGIRVNRFRESEADFWWGLAESGPRGRF